MHHRYEIQGLATFYSMIYLARLLINGLFLDDTLVGLEDGSLIVPRSADAEIGLVEMESAGPQRVGLEIDSKWRWGPVDRPVFPPRPMMSPALTI